MEMWDKSDDDITQVEREEKGRTKNQDNKVRSKNYQLSHCLLKTTLEGWQHKMLSMYVTVSKIECMGVAECVSSQRINNR